MHYIKGSANQKIVCNIMKVRLYIPNICVCDEVHLIPEQYWFKVVAGTQMYVQMHACTYVFLRSCTEMHTSTKHSNGNICTLIQYTHMHIYIYINVHPCMCACIHLCMDICRGIEKMIKRQIHSLCWG